MERRTYPRDVKLTAQSFDTLLATWEDRNAGYQAKICFFDMKWYLTSYLVRTLKEGDGRARELNIYSDANWAIKVGLEALVVPAKLDALQSAFVEEKAAKQHEAWLAQQQAKAMTEAAAEMLASLRHTRAYLERRNDALTLDELKANVAASLDKAEFKLAPHTGLTGNETPSGELSASYSESHNES